MRRKFCNKIAHAVTVSVDKCKKCSTPGNPWTRNNKTVPTPLTDFSMPASWSIVDELLVSPILPVITIITLPGGNTAMSGHCMGIRQDIRNMVKYLPRLASECHTLVITKRTKKG